MLWLEVSEVIPDDKTSKQELAASFDVEICHTHASPLEAIVWGLTKMQKFPDF